jgi:hypothetical protein
MTVAGKPCRAWPIKGSHPPLCLVHGGKKDSPQKGSTDKGRSQKGGEEARATAGGQSPGLYGRHFHPQEKADLVDYALQDSLADEISLMRVGLSRVLDQLQGQLSVEEHARLTDLLFRGGNTVGKLMQIQRAIAGQPADAFTEAINYALDQLGPEWNIEL